MTGSSGDTDRGLRIKERILEHLDENDRFTPEDVLAIHYDSVNVWKREIVRLGYKILEGQSRATLGQRTPGAPLSPRLVRQRRRNRPVRAGHRTGERNECHLPRRRVRTGQQPTAVESAGWPGSPRRSGLGMPPTRTAPF